MLKIGAAQADITPEQPMLMGGSFKKFFSEKVLDPIMASCFVADDGTGRVAYVSCDVGTVPRSFVVAVRDRVSRATGLPAANVHLMTTHNHSAPTIRFGADTPLGDQDEAVQARGEAMRSRMADAIAACVVEAHERLAPARMGHGRGQYAGAAFNRRFIMSNGRSRMHGKEDAHVKRLQPEGPADPEVQALWFEGEDGRLLAVCVHYTSHVTNLYGRPTVSADFPGAMRQVLQGVLGDDVPVLYLQGACGNVMCREVGNPLAPGGLDNARRIGRGLAGEALKIMHENYADAEGAPVRTAARTLQVPYRDVPPMPFDEAQEKWACYKGRWEEFVRLDIEERAHVNSTLRLLGHKQQSQAEEVEVSAFALGDVFFATNPAELFVEFQLDIKKRFHGRKVIVTELTNGWIGYVPTKVACALGGYETIQTRFNPGTGDLIRDVSCELLEEVMGQARS